MLYRAVQLSSVLLCLFSVHISQALKSTCEFSVVVIRHHSDLCTLQILAAGLSEITAHSLDHVLHRMLPKRKCYVIINCRTNDFF